MDGPSGQLRSLLAELKLADAGQLRRCQPIVRALARDLPAFDSVWIDALVQLRRLTPYQAEQIAAGSGERLAVGPFTVLEPLHRDECLTLFRARRTATGDPVQLARMEVLPEELRDAAGRLEQWVHHAEQASMRRPAGWRGLPRDVLPMEHILWVASPLQQGLSADALLIRRGRFPPEVVEGIAAQLARELAAVESGGLVHGDIRPSNLVLDRRGQVMLRNWGLLAAALPAVTIHSRAPLEFLRGLAPERLRQPEPPSVPADLYSAGCLLWQLLAGRPPYLTADPLALRTAHLTRRIADVREFAPETPPRLAELIARMTQPDPHQRPASFAEVQQMIDPGRTGRRRLSRFATAFESAAPRTSSAAASTGGQRHAKAAAMIVTLLIGGLGYAYQHHWWWANQSAVRPADDSPPGTLPLVAPPPPLPPVTVASYEVPQLADEPNSDAVRDLPAPNAEGVVELVGGGRYRPSSLTYQGSLWIRSTGTNAAVIEVLGDSLQVRAQTVHLQGIRVLPAAAGPSMPLVQILAQELIVEECRFECGDRGSSWGAAIRWQVQDVADPAAGRLHVRDTSFLKSAAVEVGSPLGGAYFENVVKTGPGPLLWVRQGVRPGYRVPLVLTRCTVRGGEALVKLTGENLQRSGRLSIQGADTAIALNETGPLLMIHGDDVPPRWTRYTEISARGIVIQPDTPLAGFHTGAAGSPILPLDEAELVVDGLLIGAFRFLGSELGSVADCVAVSENIPLRLSGTVIGADLRTSPIQTDAAGSGRTATNQFTPAPEIPYNSGDSSLPSRDQP